MSEWVSGIAEAAGVTLAFGAVFVLYRVLRPRVTGRFQKWEEKVVARYRVGHLRLVGVVERAFFGLVRAAVGIAVFGLALGWVLITLRLLPGTRQLSETLRRLIVTPVAAVGEALVGYLPNVFFIAVICAVAWYVLELFEVFFHELEQESIRISGFDPEWAVPTFKIVRFLVLAFALIAVFPYLPGSSSEAFKGVSVFLGILVSLSSSSAIANVFAGLILTYTKAFKLGDRVQIGEAFGDILEKSLLVTRIRTIKHVVITVPNSAVLSSQIQNFSAAGREGGGALRLHTAVTIGYDAPWRTVHELLIGAALDTKGILAEPAPFVLQTALNDFFVTYEINGYTSDPFWMVETLSGLHEKIQDRFNEAGLEIMSPHYTSLRDGNTVTIPAAHRPPGYEPPPFRIR